MKKKSMILVAALLATSMLAGCSTNNNQSESTGTADTSITDTLDDSSIANIYLKDLVLEDYMTMEGDYKGLELSITPKEEVTQEQIEALALNAYNNNISAESGGVTDRAAVLGDTVNIDYVGKQDGVAFEGGTGSGQSLSLGSGQFIPGFEDGLVGVMPGATVELNITFPADYGNAEMAGVAVVFTVTVNYIYPSSTEEMQDEVISLITSGEYATVDAFLDYCRDYLEYNADYNYNMDRQSVVISSVEALANFTALPQELVDRYAATVRSSLDAQAASYGVDADTYCNYYFSMDATTYANLAAEASTRQGMVFRYIADQENLNLTDEEFQTALEEFAEENQFSSVEELLAQGDEEEFREYFMFEKVVDFVIANAAVTE